MDILAARKKAAERARLQKEMQQALPPEEAAQVDAVPAAPAMETVPVPVIAEPEPLQNPSAAVPAEAASDEQVQQQQEELQVPELEMLSFRLGDEEYAVLVEDVREVLKDRDLTPIPNAPDYILGVTSLRGPILPVIDLGKRLRIPSPVRNEKSRILVVNVNEEDAGIVVDRVSGVVRIHPDSIRPVPGTIEHGAEYLKGIARKDDRLYILLDVEKALGT